MATKKTQKENKGPVNYVDLKSFEDFCAARNIDPKQLPGVDNLPEEFREPLIAVYKIMVGVSAVMDGKKVDFTEDTSKYYPWARVLSSGSGFDYSFSGAYYGCRYSRAGSRLCTDNSKKTMHVFSVLEEEYKKWLI